MTIETITTEELQAEIDRRQEAERIELRSELADLDARAAAIRAKLGMAVPAKAAAIAPTEAQVLAVLAGRDAHISPADVAKAFGVSRTVIGPVLAGLVTSGKVIRSGKGRGVKYGVAGKGAIVTD